MLLSSIQEAACREQPARDAVDKDDEIVEEIFEDSFQGDDEKEEDKSNEDTNEGQMST